MAVDVPPNKFELLVMESEKEGKRQARRENYRRFSKWLRDIAPLLFYGIIFFGIVLGVIVILIYDLIYGL